MYHHRHVAVAMIEGLPLVRVKIFKLPGKCLRQAINPFGMDYGVIFGPELIPAQRASILAIFVELAIQSSRNKQKQNEAHSAFAIHSI